jgi:hypothetical protein
MHDMTNWGTDLDNFCGCVIDIADNMNNFGKMLEEKHNILQGYCIDHIMQLTVKMAFKSTHCHLSSAFILLIVVFLVKLNLIIYFNCACTKLILTHKGPNRPGATIPSSFERGVIRTSYPTPVRPCKYRSMVASMGMMRFSASSKYSLANSAQHLCPL